MDNKTIVVKDDKRTAVFANSGSFIIEVDERGRSTAPDIEPEKNKTGNKPWAPYGKNDKFPLEHIDKLNKLSVGKTAINFNADTAFGAGILWCKRIVENNKLIKVPVISTEWEEFEELVDFEMLRSQAVENLEYWYWTPVLCRTNEAGTKLFSMTALDPMYCRLEKRKNGVTQNIYFSYQFPSVSPDSKDIVKYPVYNPALKGKQKEFVVLLYYQTPGMIYYPVQDYLSVFENGWVDVAISVPEIINIIYANSATFKYVVKVPKAYFLAKYADWDEKPELQEARISLLYEEVKKRLTGKEATHILLLSIFSEMNGTEAEGLTVEPIKDYLDKSADLPNNAAANSEILFALGVDPANIGLGIPGGKNLSGSGSDKREARDNKIASQYRSRLVQLWLARFCRDFNNMNSLKGYKPYIVDEDTSQTLDENPTGSQNKIGGA